MTHEFKNIDDAIDHIKKTYWGGNEYSFDAHNSDGEFSCIGGLVKQYKSGSSDIHFLVRDAITLAVTIKSAKINPNIVSTDENDLTGKEIAMIESQLKSELHYLEVDIYGIKEHVRDLNMDCDVSNKGDHETDSAFNIMNEWRDALRECQAEKKTIGSILTKLKQQKKTS